MEVVGLMLSSQVPSAPWRLAEVVRVLWRWPNQWIMLSSVAELIKLQCGPRMTDRNAPGWNSAPMAKKREVGRER